MPENYVLSGYLQHLWGRPIPSWVYPPHTGSNLLPRVYVRKFNGDGLIAHLDRVPDLRVRFYGEYNCYIPLRNNLVLIGDLQPHDHRNITDRATRVFVRIPDRNNTVYMTELEIGDGYRPEWLP